SRTETYDDILPFRNEGISAFISVMRGCDKFCTFCVVPYTRGRERSRSIRSIVEECKELEQQGFREITLLGQNVNSYRDIVGTGIYGMHGIDGIAESHPKNPNNPINPGSDNFHDFSDLLAACAKSVPNLRIRYTTSHPQDFDQKLVDTMAEHDNICKYIHLPIQSGSDRILKLMNRTYSRAHYMSIIDMIRRAGGGGWALSTDIIVGFCTETLEDHEMTKQVMRDVEYDGAYTFNYSPRPNTRAWNTLADDVSIEEKTRRLQEIIALQNEISTRKNLAEIGRELTVLVEGRSKKNAEEWKGRTDTNKMVVFPREDAEVGEYRKVKITRSNSATLFGKLTNSPSYEAERNRRGQASPTMRGGGSPRGEVLYDLTPLVISSIESRESAGMMELPVVG
ncbi:MAG: MiaB/RimO family radical SAM methylthiotransferase, partial [Candidatus Kapaibacterium sp.]